MDNLKETAKTAMAKTRSPMEYLPQLVLGLLIAALIFIFDQSQLHEAWRFDRELFSHQPLQALSHALIHLNAQHLALNVTGLLTIYLLFSSAFRSLWWLVAIGVSALASAYGVFYYSPETDWLVGLSGALHGLFVYAVLRSRASLAWIAALVIKLAIEQNPHWLPANSITDFTERLINNNIIVDAHLWGAAGGLLFFLIARSFATLLVIVELNRAEK